ncbi:protein kinase domain-containing protein [Lentzea flava]|uniref:non-specific serine/threonine protein kinase n=1 Tax=Lentzea flava TaxID=103732 RepID=A0ABQ2V3I9_9PSEU|nr:protein kinase [Lentzea flava]MCP2203135.1 Serine/threonine protein kinase [Lentzea flava]GGU65944.1 serine/threonine protein kinase [Lentzea flava]
MPEQGEVIAERYRLMSLVGNGSMGVVWQARDEHTGRVVAVKLLNADRRSPDAVAQMLREGRVAGRLRHPHAISVYDVVEHDGKPCLVLEYLPSRSLAALIAERGALPPGVVADIGRQIAAALAAAHAEGIVHRDVSTFNVLVAEDDIAKITDFGIARAVGEGTVTDARLIVGTPAFLAPEVAAGEAATFASDVFSLGATLYAALEGVPPFGVDENPYALLQRVVRAEVEPPRSGGPLGEVLLRLLRRDGAERPTMAEAHKLLAAVAEGLPLPAATPKSGTRLLLVRRPRRVIAMVAGAAALIAAGVVIGTVVQGDRPGSAQANPTTTTPATACDARYEVTNSWPGGYQVEVTVRNTSPRGLSGWTVTWQPPAGHTIGNLWNGTLTQNATAVTVTNAGHNAVLATGGTTSFGFVAAGPEPARPAVTCSTAA